MTRENGAARPRPFSFVQNFRTWRSGQELKRRATLLLLCLLAGSVTASACSSETTSAKGTDGTLIEAPETTTAQPSTTTRKPLSDPGKGWIGGEPNWASAVVEDKAAEFAAPADTGTAGASGGESDLLADVVTASPAASRDLAKSAAKERLTKPAAAALAEPAVEAAPPIGDIEAEPISDPGLPDDISVAQDVTIPRAGSVDDNEKFEDYLGYVKRISSLNIPLRTIDVTGRSVITVKNSAGRAIAGEPVVFKSGTSTVATLRTTANGTVRFHPRAYGVAGPVTANVGGKIVPLTEGAPASVTIDALAPDSAVIDILFLLDATGSMGDEIDQLKKTIDDVAQRVGALKGVRDVRIGMTLYRDTEDSFVTSTYDFTTDIAAFRDQLAKVQADGGGDYPEALDEGLAEALTKPTWRPAGMATQLIFLVGDAPPQVQRDVQLPYNKAVQQAAERGIKIFPIASSESDDQAEAAFRQIAQFTGARFVFLSYGAEGGGAATGVSTNIASTDYEELSLNDLVVRLVAEEAAAFIGATDVVVPTSPTVTSSTTTKPKGQ